jgi:GTPase SAR1 family protein
MIILLYSIYMVKKAKIIFLGDTAVGKSCIINAINGHPISNTH